MPRKILIVGNDSSWSARLVELYTKMGQQVLVGADGESASRRLKEGEFDLAVIKHGNPGISPSEILSEVKAEGCPTPVIIFAEHECPEDEQKTRLLGVDFFFLNSFTSGDLPAVSNKLFAQYDRARGRAPERKVSENDNHGD